MEKMDIKILGSGCSRCKKTYETVKYVVEEDKLEATVEYVTDIVKILDYNILSLPAVVIDGKRGNERTGSIYRPSKAVVGG